ncbi:MAG: collagen-like protein, partial [Clostridia bacterium]|nr:collagen-like protein [Clostridia bacterium]
QGEKGDKGDTGAQGEKGEKGDTGAQGEKGDKGDTGAQGEKGEKGDKGAQGEKGEKGEKGDTGAQGEKGEKGDTGAQGEKGEKGDTGAQGEKGEDGKDGVGIEKVEYDENGDLKITFTDSTTQTIVMPDKHVHTFGEWTNFTTENVSCENRLLYRVCSSCNSIEWRQGAYEDHRWATEYSFDNSEHWLECDVCEEVKDKQAHTVESSGECSVCKELVGATAGVVYEILSDGTAQVKDYTGTATRVRIAETYQGVAVTKIGDNAFAGCSSLTSVIIPDRVTSIAFAAFANCSSLINILIPESVTSIGEDAFNGCSSLQFSEYENGKYLGSQTNDYFALIETKNKNFSSHIIHNNTKIIANYAFYAYWNLTSIAIPDSVTSIGAYAFYDCEGLTSVTIGDSVTSIGAVAFQSCYSLKSVTIGESVISIGSSAFKNCSELTSIVIPDSVTSIGGMAFYGCSKLQFNEYGNAKYLGSKTNDYFALIETKSKDLSSYTIHNDTKIIAGSAFYECGSLASIVIPNSITSIGEYAFSYCDSLTKVYYKGTATDWAEISIESRNESLTNATRYYYSETTPSVSGNYWHYNEQGEVVVW